MFGLGMGEILVILVIALIFIGPKKLPGLAKGLGKGIREFQGALNGLNNDIKNPSSQEKFDEVDKQQLTAQTEHSSLPTEEEKEETQKDQDKVQNS